MTLRFSSIAYVWLWVLVSIPIGRAADAPVDLVSVLPDSSGRLVLWKVGEKQFATLQPATASIATNPTTGKLALGFTHSGYSAEDPDGKNAILTFTVKLSQKPISEDEKALLTKNGISLQPDLVVNNPKFTQVDISLKADPDEEKRIRNDLLLPRMIGDANANQPFSIRWKGVPGPTLYKWLTDPNDGLKVVFKGGDASGDDVEVSWKVSREYAIDSDKLNEWWKKHAGDKDTYSWHGGIGPVVQSLVSEGVVNVHGASAGIEDVAPEIRVLTDKVKSLAVASPRGVLSVTKSNVLSLAGKGVSALFSLEGRVDALPANMPGREILAHPDYVKDLTGNGVGLDPLKGMDK